MESKDGDEVDHINIYLTLGKITSTSKNGHMTTRNKFLPVTIPNAYFPFSHPITAPFSSSDRHSATLEKRDQTTTLHRPQSEQRQRYCSDHNRARRRMSISIHFKLMNAFAAPIDRSRHNLLLPIPSTFHHVPLSLSSWKVPSACYDLPKKAGELADRGTFVSNRNQTGRKSPNFIRGFSFSLVLVPGSHVSNTLILGLWHRLFCEPQV